MKKIVTVFFIFLAWMSVAKADQVKIERPTWRVGYTWVIEESYDGKVIGRQVTRVTEVDKDGYIVEITYQPKKGEITRGRIRYNFDLNIVKLITLGVEGSQEFYPHDSKFFWEISPGEKIVQYYNWTDNRIRIRRGDVKVVCLISWIDEDHLKFSRVLTGRFSQTWETKDDIIFSISKGWIEYRQVEGGGHTNEARLIEFSE